MPNYNFKIKFKELLELFNFQKDYESIDDYISDYPCETFYQYWWEEFNKEYPNQQQDDILDIYYNLCKMRKDLYIEIINLIENFFNRISCNNFKFSINFDTKINEDDTFNLTIKTEDLSRLVGKGMDAYGYFNWSAHSENDKESFIKDSYLVLREFLHWHEACESKPKLKYSFGAYDFWDIPTHEEVFEAIG